MPALTALVTGATDGIGRATVLELARRGYEVIVHGRTPERVEAVCAEASRVAKGRPVGACIADLSRYEEVREAAEQLGADYTSLDVLVNNAGVFMKERVLNPSGHEMTLAVNHLGHFLLTHLLLPSLRASASARVLNLSSMAHGGGVIDFDDLQSKKSFSPRGSYANSKLANVLFTFELARRLRGTAVAVNALHPGVISTKLLTEGFGFSGRSIEEGILTTMKVATDPALEGVTGRYFSDEREVRASQRAYDAEVARRLYDTSATLVGVDPLPRAPA